MGAKEESSGKRGTGRRGIERSDSKRKGVSEQKEVNKAARRPAPKGKKRGLGSKKKKRGRTGVVTKGVQCPPKGRGSTALKEQGKGPSGGKS